MYFQVLSMVKAVGQSSLMTLPAVVQRHLCKAVPMTATQATAPMLRMLVSDVTHVSSA